jgi:RimJ/RimL family protein N-acetyltransferase
VVLRPVLTRDYEYLYYLCVAGENGHRWRYRGATPSPDQFVRQLWDGVLAQYMVVPRSGDRPPIGLVGIYNANFASDYAYGFVISAPDRRATGLSLHGLLLVLHYSFETWDFEKLYFELPELNLPQFGSAMKYLSEEGRLKNHEKIAGVRYDLLTLALYRDVWTKSVRRLLRVVLTPQAFADAELDSSL